MKTRILILVVVGLSAFAAGRYLNKPETVTKEKIVEVEKEVVKHETKYITIVKKPDGTTETTIVVDKDSKSNTQKSIDSTVKVEYGSKVNVAILAGLQPKLADGLSLGPIVYGASVTKQLFGPITVGAWGLSSLTFGASLGWNF